MIHLACAADDQFALPLAATVRSVLNTMERGRELRLFVLDGGISSTNRERLLASWAGEPLTVDWIEVNDEHSLKDLSSSGHVSKGTYFRLLISQLLPKQVSKCIYLDSDLLVRTDLGKLWETPLGDNHCLAAPDVAAPFIDADVSFRNSQKRIRHVARARPIENYIDLNIDPQAHYFNAGVMLIDLDRWRQDGISEQLFRCLHENESHVLWWDQYALNVVLAQKWMPLDLRWNQGSYIYRYSSWEQSPFDEDTFCQTRNDPFIVHFTDRVKPWHARSRHPFRQEFLSCLDTTNWKGWRPSKSQLAAELVAECWRRCRGVTSGMYRRISRKHDGPGQ
ncbi:MAG: glycosyltransferase family 8 protein [Planctomycetota bacterium]